MRKRGQIITKGKNSHLVRVYLGTDADGKRRYHNRTIRGTKKDALRYQTSILSDMDRGTFVEPPKEILN